MNEISDQNMNGETPKRNELTICIIASAIGESPREVVHSFVFDEALRLSQKGLSVHIVRSKIGGQAFSYGMQFHGIEKMFEPHAFYLMIRNINRYPPVTLLRTPLHIFWENLYAYHVLKVTEKYNVDLLHAHFAYPEGWIGLLSKIKTSRKIPLVITSHGYDLNIVEKYKYGIRLHSRYDVLVRKVVKEADHIIVPSKLLYLRAIEAGAESSKISIIPNAVDPFFFDPKKHSGVHFRKKYGLGDAKIVLTVRSLRKYYGIDMAIRVASRIPDYLNVKYVIIGGNSDSNADLRKLAGNILGKKVIYLGQLPHNEIPCALAAADIVVDPCPIGQGLNILEAMSMEKPVIGIRTRLWDYIVDGYTGFLVSNEHEMFEKILYLLENPAIARSMGSNGRKLVEEKYNIEKRVGKIIEIYKKLLEK
jgi:glycosyltransferase involved in cell wall biosynthesis